MDERHAPRYVQGKLKSLGGIYNNATVLVKESEEGAVGKVLCDHYQVWGMVTTSNHRKDVWVREDPVMGRGIEYIMECWIFM